MTKMFCFNHDYNTPTVFEGITTNSVLVTEPLALILRVMVPLVLFSYSCCQTPSLRVDIQSGVQVDLIMNLDTDSY